MGDPATISAGGPSRTLLWMERAISAGAFPWASAAVGGPRGNLFCSELPRRPGEAADGPVRLYDLASLTKLMSTTMITLRLMDRGEIRLADPIARFLPQAPADKAAITILDLLRHTGGFEAHFLLEDAVGSRSARDGGVVDTILTRPLAYPPGARVEYSCIGFILLGRILEEITGRQLDRLAREAVFSPLGLEDTGYRPIPETGGAAGPSPVAGRSTEEPAGAGHHEATDTLRSASVVIAPTERDPCTGDYVHGVVHDENARYLNGVSGNAGLFSSVHDCAAFAGLLLNRCEGFLKPETFGQMVTDWTADLDVARGLGVSIWRKGVDWAPGPFLGTGAFGHTGFTGTSIYVSPELDRYFVLLTNRVHYGRDLDVMGDYRSDFHRTAVQEYCAPHTSGRSDTPGKESSCE